jgi:methylenetetrahydrofolate dehydrogenase (NADP+)/methenyltetrahydrofolate cyclohydrolase/formyltetrahydrofolate synthetase
MNSSARIINGKALAESLRLGLAREISINPQLVPHLAVIQVGARSDSSLYVRMKQRAAEQVGRPIYHLIVGIKYTLSNLGEETQQIELLQLIGTLNADVTGMLR